MLQVNDFDWSKCACSWRLRWLRKFQVIDSHFLFPSFIFRSLFPSLRVDIFSFDFYTVISVNFQSKSTRPAEFFSINILSKCSYAVNQAKAHRKGIEQSASWSHLHDKLMCVQQTVQLSFER